MPTSARTTNPPFPRFHRLLAHRFGGAVIAAGTFLTTAIVVRLALLAASFDVVDWTTGLLGTFFWGAIFDLAAVSWWLIPILILLALLPRGFFDHHIGRSLAHAGLCMLVALVLFGAVAEWFFWDEFSARFNFIAVDYLVYTTEVVGNIRESYPMPVIFLGLGASTALIHGILLRQRVVQTWLDHAGMPAGRRWRIALTGTAACLIPALGVNLSQLPAFRNNYNRELAQNGTWSLFAAFRANQLDYARFYPTMPEQAAFNRLHGLLSTDGAEAADKAGNDTLRQIINPGPELHPNVIQITVESLSAEYLGYFGNTNDITPNLDALIPQSLVFDNFYATGNRTDRGMESLTLSLPPTPGRSIVKRPNNENLFTLGSVFRSRGYETAFIYGGYGYFDNMNYFFGHNGYRVLDRTKVAESDVTFANVWGACDEDLFRWTLREADADAASGRPFHYFVMTTSNHRPYTFPDNRIDLPSKEGGRRGGVKYTDFALGEFLRAAAAKPWYKDTVFVIVADHCASSAGKTALPVEKYHIPLIIFSPGGQIAPGKIETLTSQVDYAPTLLGLLNWTYRSRFFGWDVRKLPSDNHGRALMATYQKLGFFRSEELGILSPPRLYNTFVHSPREHTMQEQIPDRSLENDAIAYYQTASELYKTGRYLELEVVR